MLSAAVLAYGSAMALAMAGPRRARQPLRRAAAPRRAHLLESVRLPSRRRGPSPPRRSTCTRGGGGREGRGAGRGEGGTTLGTAIAAPDPAAAVASHPTATTATTATAIAATGRL